MTFGMQSTIQTITQLASATAEQANSEAMSPVQGQSMLQRSFYMITSVSPNLSELQPLLHVPRPPSFADSIAPKIPT